MTQGRFAGRRSYETDGSPVSLVRESDLRTRALRNAGVPIDPNNDPNESYEVEPANWRDGAIGQPAASSTGFRA